MSQIKHAASRDVRSRIAHPVIDTDAHTLEVTPVFLDYLKQVGGAAMVERFKNNKLGHSPAWWTAPTRSTLDRATASLPRLLHKRLDDIGIDYAVLYPTLGNQVVQYQDDELRRASCRAYNLYQADMFRGLGDRLTPAAVIPMHTPKEALEEMDFAVKSLGMKVGVFYRVIRPNARPHPQRPDLMLPANRFDCFGLDSDYDYDPVWAKSIEAQFPMTSHSTSSGFGTRQSPTNFVYSKIGHFAAASEALCKSLLMGGVTRRFPQLKFAFMEAGVSWGLDLYTEMVNVWRKRNPEAMRRELDPALIDRPQLFKLFEEYGHERVKANMEGVKAFFGQASPDHRSAGSQPPATLDDWAAAKIRREEDLKNLFVDRFYFGAEGDNPMVATAFRNPMGIRFRPVLGSDIGHWDVSDMEEVLEESYEPVEEGHMTAQEFKEFVFLNPVSLYTAICPDFFKGTKIEKEVFKAIKAGDVPK